MVESMKLTGIIVRAQFDTPFWIWSLIISPLHLLWITVLRYYLIIGIEFLHKLLLPIFMWRIRKHGSCDFGVFLAVFHLFYVLMESTKCSHLWKFPKPNECELWLIYLPFTVSFSCAKQCNDYIYIPHKVKVTKLLSIWHLT